MFPEFRWSDFRSSLYFFCKIRFNSVTSPWWFLIVRSLFEWNLPAADSWKTSPWPGSSSPSTNFAKNSWPNRYNFILFVSDLKNWFFKINADRCRIQIRPRLLRTYLNCQIRPRLVALIWTPTHSELPGHTPAWAQLRQAELGHYLHWWL